jgi:hypothetical protein
MEVRQKVSSTLNMRDETKDYFSISFPCFETIMSGRFVESCASHFVSILADACLWTGKEGVLIGDLFDLLEPSGNCTYHEM